MECQLYRLKEIKKHKDKPLRNTAGIYALVHDNKVIYVGQSVSMRDRLLKHSHADKRLEELFKTKTHTNTKKYLIQKERYEFIKENIEDILYLFVPCEKDKLDELEKYYITKHQPKYNYVGVYCNYIIKEK